MAGKIIKLKKMSAAEERECTDLVATADSLELYDQTTYDSGRVVLDQIKRFGKTIEDYHKTMKSNAKTTHQSIVDAEKKFLTPVQEAEKKMKAKMVKCLSENPNIDKGDNISLNDGWEVDITEPDKVPRNYCIPNKKLIEEKVKAQGKFAEEVIPGIEVNQKSTITARSIDE